MSAGPYVCVPAMSSLRCWLLIIGGSECKAPTGSRGEAHKPASLDSASRGCWEGAPVCQAAQIEEKGMSLSMEWKGRKEGDLIQFL